MVSKLVQSQFISFEKTLQTSEEKTHSFLETQHHLQAENCELQKQSLSYICVQAARTSHEIRTSAKFDPQNVATFKPTAAGNKQLRRAVHALKRIMSIYCFPVRGSAESLAATTGGVPLTASVVKRQMTLQSFFDEKLPAGDGEEGFDDLLTHLPLKLQAHVRTVRYISDRLKAAFAALKFCIILLAAGVAPTLVDERDRHGLMRAISHTLGIPRKPGSVPTKQ